MHVTPRLPLGPTFALLGALCSAAPTNAAIIYVDDAPPGGNGFSWSTAFRHLQDARRI